MMVYMLDPTTRQEEYSAIGDQHTRTGDCFIIVYDITSRTSFEEAEQLLQFVHGIKDSDDVPIVLVGNKVDLEDNRRAVSKAEGLTMAKRHGDIPFFESSAKLRINVDEAVHELLRITPRRGVEYRVVVLGAGGVGKSAFTVQFTSRHFVEGYVMKRCQQILLALMAHKHGWPFNQPVDPVLLCLPDYFDIIKHPMDLGTVKYRLEAGYYENEEEFAKDVRLVWSNAFIYNPPHSDISIMATTLSEIFENKLEALKQTMDQKNSCQFADRNAETSKSI